MLESAGGFHFGRAKTDLIRKRGERRRRYEAEHRPDGEPNFAAQKLLKPEMSRQLTSLFLSYSVTLQPTKRYKKVHARQ